MAQTPEQRLDKEIMLYCGKRGWECYHINVGGGKLKNGTYFKTGVPKGWSDLFIIKGNGEVMWCETKIYPNKPTQEQLDFIDRMLKKGYNAFVCYTLEEFIAKCDLTPKICPTINF